MPHTPLPIVQSRTSWDEFARWHAILTDPAAVAAAHSAYPATDPALGDGLAISPEAAAALFSAPLDGSPSPNFYPATIIDQRALTTLTLDTSVASGVATSTGGVTLPYTWRGWVLQGGSDATVPPVPPLVCLDPEYACYSRMGRGDTYTPAISQANPSLHDVDSGGFRTDSWIEIGAPAGVAAAVIDSFLGGNAIELGATGETIGAAVALQVAVKPQGTFTGTFAKIWNMTGNLQVELYGRRVGGVDEYEWRISAQTLTATTKTALAQDGWVVVSALFEYFHLSCEVASATCSGAPFGYNNQTIVKITDLQSLQSITQEFSGTTGNSIDGMNFAGQAAKVGWACALVAFRRTGLVLSEITIPASCLSNGGNDCVVTLVDTCMAFDPTRCIECYPTDRVIPLRVKCGGDSPEVTLTITAGGAHVLYDELVGIPAALGSGGVEVDPTFRIDPSNCFPVQIVDTGAEVVVEDTPLALPVRAAGAAAGRPSINPPPTPPPDPTPGPDPAPTPDADPTCAVPSPSASTNTDCNDPI